MILDKYDNEMLIWIRSDSELSMPVYTSQSATESQLADWRECKNNTKIIVDTTNNVTVYYAKLAETMGWTMTVPINVKGCRILAIVDSCSGHNNYRGAHSESQQFS